MAETLEKPTIAAGTPTYANERISFEGASHSGYVPARKDFRDAHKALIAKRNASPEIQTKWNELLTQMDTDGLSREARRAKIADFNKSNLREEYDALQRARNETLKVRKELHGAQVTALDEVKSLPGATEEQVAKAAQNFKAEGKRGLKAANRQVNAGLFNTQFAVLHEEGIGAALKNNFGLEAMKSHPGKTALKGGGIAVGIGATLDATFRSQKTGPDGKPVDRSWVARLAEGGAGLTLAAASALHGRVR